jgi:hypothetical protein
MLDYLEVLRPLVSHKVDFILVGGLSAIMNGVPMNTMDVDVVHSRSEENLPRILAALAELDAWYRLRTDMKLVPRESHLRSPGHQLLRTVHGDLDLLGSIDDGLVYEDLEKYSSLLEAGPGVWVKTLNLEKYVEIKEKLNRDKDRYALPTLRAALAEKKRLRK